MPRILVLAESLPYPTVKGGDLRNWQNINALAPWARVAVFGLCSNDGRRHRVPALPLESWTASTDPALTSPPPSNMNLSARAWLLEPAGHPSDLYFSEAAARELSHLLDVFRPDVAIVEGLWLHGYLDVLRAAGCRIVLDCHNVEAATFHALARTNERRDFEGRVIRDVLPARTEAIERRAIAAVDQIWVCSCDDERRMREMYDPTTSIFVVPNGIRIEDYDGARTGTRSDSGVGPLALLFPAIFSYPPNAIAATFLVEQVLPRLAAACEECRLLLVGAMPSPELSAAALRDPRVVVTGAVRDVRPYFADATALAVPLFHGSGTRFKILEAFASGLAVISTGKGAEGLDVRDGAHLLIAESADEFVHAALRIRRDRALTDRLVAAAGAHVAARFSWSQVAVSVREAIGALGVTR